MREGEADYDTLMSIEYIEEWLEETDLTIVSNIVCGTLDYATALRKEKERLEGSLLDVRVLVLQIPEINQANRVGKGLLKICEIITAALSELEEE